MFDVDGNGRVTLDEYKGILRKTPGLFQWFNILNNNAGVPHNIEMDYSSQTGGSTRLRLQEDKKRQEEKE